MMFMYFLPHSHGSGRDPSNLSHTFHTCRLLCGPDKYIPHFPGHSFLRCVRMCMLGNKKKKSVSYGCQDSAIRCHTDIQRIYLCSRCRGNHNTHDCICHTCLRPHPRHTDTVRPRHMSWKLILTGCSYRPSSLHFFANQRNRAEGKRKRKKIKHASMLKCMCVCARVCVSPGRCHKLVLSLSLDMNIFLLSDRNGWKVHH